MEARRISSSRALAPRRSPLARQRLERAIELYLRDCFRARSVARVSELADRLGANRPHLSRLVSRTLGKSLGSALRERQLAYAARLLAETSLSVAEVSSAAAFGTERTFFRAFKNAFDETPAAYRAKSNQLSVDGLASRR